MSYNRTIGLTADNTTSSKRTCLKQAQHYAYSAVFRSNPIGADSTGATGNFAPVLTQEPGQTLRFAPVPFMAVL